MNPLMYSDFLPDSEQVSRAAAERHAKATRVERRPRAPVRFPLWRYVPQM